MPAPSPRIPLPFHGYKSGHELNNLLVRKLLADPKASQEVTFDSADALPRAFALIYVFERVLLL